MKLLKAFKWIMTIVSLVLVALGIFWFIYAIKSIPSSDEATCSGLGLALGMVFNLMADISVMISSLAGIILSITEKKKLTSTRNSVSLIINVITGISGLLMFVAMLIIF